MATYRNMTDEVGGLVKDVMRQYHTDLAERGVTVEVIGAFADTDDAGQPRGPALKHHGWPALATVKINALKDRVAGMSDARITLDGDRWPELNHERQLALIDHELEHLEIVRDSAGGVKLDDAGRPKLTMRPHDFELGGFESVVNRHKRNAPETDVYEGIYKKFTQLLFPWG